MMHLYMFLFIIFITNAHSSTNTFRKCMLYIIIINIIAGDCSLSPLLRRKIETQHLQSLYAKQRIFILIFPILTSYRACLCASYAIYTHTNICERKKKKMFSLHWILYHDRSEALCRICMFTLVSKNGQIWIIKTEKKEKEKYCWFVSNSLLSMHVCWYV